MSGEGAIPKDAVEAAARAVAHQVESVSGSVINNHFFTAIIRPQLEAALQAALPALRSEWEALLKEERERVERVRQELLERADQVASDGLAAHKGACRCCCKRCVGGAAFTSRADGLREAAQLLADPDLPVGGEER